MGGVAIAVRMSGLGVLRRVPVLTPNLGGMPLGLVGGALAPAWTPN